MSNQKQIALAALMFTQDNNEILPSVSAIWGTVFPASKATICLTASTFANAYVYNAELSSVPLQQVGNLNSCATAGDVTSCFLTADGATTETIGATGLFLAPATISANCAYTAADIAAKRHGLGTGFLASFVDGHVEFRTTANIVTTGYTPPGITVGTTPGVLTTINLQTLKANAAGAVNYYLNSWSATATNSQMAQTSANLFTNITVVNPGIVYMQVATMFTMFDINGADYGNYAGHNATGLWNSAGSIWFTVKATGNIAEKLDVYVAVMNGSGGTQTASIYLTAQSGSNPAMSGTGATAPYSITLPNNGGNIYDFPVYIGTPTAGDIITVTMVQPAFSWDQLAVVGAVLNK